MNEHRFILFTFNQSEELQLRHTWKDSYSTLQEELKNISHESRNNSHVNGTKECSVTRITGPFEEFMEKFEASYFNCTNLTGGNFILKESENIFVFCLSNQKWKLELFNEKLRLGWQRKNIFIQLHPNSYKEFCEKESSFNYFPVTNLRDSDQLARSLCHANIFNSFETPNMEILGKGGISNFIIDQNDSKFILNSNYSITSDGLLKPTFSGKPKWPIPNTLTDESWTDSKPKLLIQNTFDSETIPRVQFDEYFTFSPKIHEFLKESYCKYFTISVQSKIGIIPIGFGELIEETTEISNSNVPLFKVFIGPFNYTLLTNVMYGFEPFSKYLQNIPQFYEYFLHSNLGELKWNELCKQSGGKSSSWRNEFPLPIGLLESKNYFKSSSWRQKCKNDLLLLVERAENSHRSRTGKRNSSYHPFVFPSLSQLKKDSGHLDRLLFRFKSSLQIFLSSSDEKLGCSNELNQFQLPQVLFKHRLSVHQMTDFSEVIQKKRSLRPLFNENERDLFHILKDMPFLAEEMSSAQFVSGDIFGNPYKKERKTREPSKMAKKRYSSTIILREESIEEIASESEDKMSIDSESEYGIEMGMPSPMSIDEIDFKEMEDIKTEIVINGSVINSSQNENDDQTDEKSSPSKFYDLLIVKKWIKSPGGLDAQTKLIEILPIISDLDDLNNLALLSKRFKRIKLTNLIMERISTI